MVSCDFNSHWRPLYFLLLVKPLDVIFGHKCQICVVCEKLECRVSVLLIGCLIQMINKNIRYKNNHTSFSVQYFCTQLGDDLLQLYIKNSDPCSAHAEAGRNYTTSGNKNAFQKDAYRPLQWPSDGEGWCLPGAGCLPRGDV